MQVAPPTPRIGYCVINEDALARPNARYKEITVAATLEVVSLQPLFEGEITIAGAVGSWLVLHAGIDDRDELDSLLPQFFRECFGIRETRGIESEDAIAEHVVDVEMNHVEREIAFAILARNVLDHRVGIVTPAA